MKPYISSILTTLDPGTGNQKQAKTEQTLDLYGNATQTKVYDYGSLVTPARTYTNTYLTDSNYISRYIRDRLTLSTVTNGSETITLVTNGYDGPVQTSKGSIWSTHDDVNYVQSFTYRGNVTSSTRNGVSISRGVDLAGTTTSITNNGYTQSITSAWVSNDDVPNQITPNNNTNLNTALTYTTYFGITSETDPNNSTSSIAYDSLTRPYSVTPPNGPTTTYTYTNGPPTTKATIKVGGGPKPPRTVWDARSRLNKPIRPTRYSPSWILSTIPVRVRRSGR